LKKTLSLASASASIGRIDIYTMPATGHIRINKVQVVAGGTNATNGSVHWNQAILHDMGTDGNTTSTIIAPSSGATDLTSANDMVLWWDQGMYLDQDATWGVGPGVYNRSYVGDGEWIRCYAGDTIYTMGRTSSNSNAAAIYTIVDLSIRY